MPDQQIVIVGGGAAGLSSAGALKHIGLGSVILDKDECIGGTWARRYERLHLHSIRAFSGLAYYSIPRHYPKYIPKDMYAEYLSDYAQHFHLKISLGCTVRRVHIGQTASAPGWCLETDRGTWRSHVVILATGHNGLPRLPKWPGQGEFEGHFMHSIEYKTGRDFVGRRVLVIGAGNSGTEIAADLAEQGAAFVALSLRTPPPVVPRDFLGVPAQVFGISMSLLPPRVEDRIANALASLALGDLTRYGLGHAGWLPFTAHKIPVIDVGLVKELKRGRVHIRPNITGFTNSGVVYEDGQEEAFHVVIAATGFKMGLEQLLDVSGVLDGKAYPKYHSGEPTLYPGLYFMGYTENIRGHLFEVEHDSRRLARNIARYLKQMTA